jgi:hypothetical protein
MRSEKVIPIPSHFFIIPIVNLAILVHEMNLSPSSAVTALN